MNPYGPAMLTFPIELLGRQEVLSHVAEWQSPTFDSLWARVPGARPRCRRRVDAAGAVA
ncbi:MAG: hypothetical protein R2695_20290 [Acidimicrobiales bacterium]